MKLNIGSSIPHGQYKRKPWVNIDAAPKGTFNARVIRMDALHLGFKDAAFDEIHAIHCLEHVNRNFRAEFIQECHRVLEKNGDLWVEVPDFETIVALLHEAQRKGETRRAHIWTTSIFGKQRYPGDQHCWGFTPATLQQLMETLNFSHVEIFTNRDQDRMISEHHKHEPILLAWGVK